MKLARLTLDDIVVIPDGRDCGGGMRNVDLRESSFRAEDGWDIRQTLPGEFTVYREGMAEPITIGGYGYTYKRMPPEAPAPEPVKKGKR